MKKHIQRTAVIGLSCMMAITSVPCTSAFAAPVVTTKSITADKADPISATDLALTATASSDYTAGWENLNGINNAAFEPTSSNVGEVGKGWGNWQGAEAGKECWVQYTWDEAQTFNMFQVYWYDDGGGTRVPSAIQLQYQDDAGEWQNFNMYATVKDVTALDTYNTILTDTITTKAVRMVMTTQASATGIYRWKVMQAPPEEALDIVAEQLKMPTKVVEDFALPATVAGVNVTWVSDNDAIKVEGQRAVVTTDKDNDVAVTLTATLTSGETTKDVPFSITVGKVNLSELADTITVPTQATEDFSLKTSFEGGVAVNWESDNTDVIDIVDGKAVVTRGLEDVTVKLTATVTKENYGDPVVKHYNVSVPKLSIDELTASIKVASEADMDFQLKTNLGNGVTVTWVSQDPSIISIDTTNEKALSKDSGTLAGVSDVAVSYAVVHRGTEDKSVTLEATVKKDSFQDTKQYKVKVPKASERVAASAVDFTKVHIEDSFWKARQKAFICETIPVGISKVEGNEGGVDNLKTAAKLNKGEITKDEALFEGSVYFLDSDPYKMIEAMSFALQIPANGDEEITAGQSVIDDKLDEWIGYIEGAQEESGYLDTYFTLDHSQSNAYPGETHDKWTNFALHEMYCNGHFYEAVAAYTRAKGYSDTRLLDVAVKNADLYYATFGINAEQRKACPGHEEIELGLIKLAAVCEEMGDATAEDGATYASKAQKYIRLAQFFLSVRGQDDDERYGYNSYTGNFHDEYDQEDCEVTDITDPVGHAVRCMYLYTGMTDVALLENTEIYDNALLTVWDNLTNKKSYVTGGIGSSAANEGFGADYELPNETAYAESCANIGSFIWNSRMNQLYGDSKYADVMERTLYNSIISCVNFDGDKFFYGNPHASSGGQGRSAWFGCACCPPNLMRLVESLGSYVYTQKDDVITMNLYIGNNADLTVGEKAFKLSTETKMPWYGTAEIEVTEADDVTATLRLRIPEWADGANKITVNGETVDLTALEQGYAVISRTWKTGDKIVIDFPMETTAYHEKEQVKEDIGYIAVKRGPVIFAAEGVDNDFDLTNAYIEEGAEFTTTWCDNLMKDSSDTYGLKAGLEVTVPGKIVTDMSTGAVSDVTWRFIPYYAWNNRDYGSMRIFVHEGKPEYTLRDFATVRISYGYNDGSQVKDGSTGSFWNGWNDSNFGTEGYKQWIMYDFGDYKVDLTACIVNWYSDGGGVIVPTGLTIEYDNNGTWTEVTPKAPFTTFTAGTDNTYEFDKITTSKIRMTMANDSYNQNCGAAISEWDVVGEFSAPSADVVEAKTKLSEAVATAEAKKQSDYTTDSWNTFVAALENARTVGANANATKTEIEAATATLQAAISGLKPVTVAPSGNNQTKPQVTNVTVNKPAGVKVKAKGKNVTVSFKKVTGADGYVIYRSKKAKSGFKKVSTLKSASKVKATIKKQKKGTYYYKVRAYKVVNGKKVYSDYSSVKKVKVK